MRDLWNLFRGNQPRLADVRCAYEIGGVVARGQPIPWCAELVHVEADIDVPQSQTPRPGDFELGVGGLSTCTDRFRWLATQP